MYFIFLLLTINIFYLIRACISLHWNEGLFKIAIEEDGSSTWYHKWDIVEAIFHPKHFSKWTTDDWFKYLKDKG